MDDYRVEFNVTPPVEATPEQVEQWIQYCVGWRADIAIDNPLSGFDLTGISGMDIQ